MRRIIPQFDLRIIVFKIGGHTARPEITPFTDNSIAQEPIVSLVRETEHNHIIELPTDLTPRPERGARINLRTHVNSAVLTQRDRAAQAAPLHYVNVAAHIDRTVRPLSRNMS